MEEFAAQAQQLCRETTLAELRADWRLAAALERKLECIGEAVKRLPAERELSAHGRSASSVTLLILTLSSPQLSSAMPFPSMRLLPNSRVSRRSACATVKAKW